MRIWRKSVGDVKNFYIRLLAARNAGSPVFDPAEPGNVLGKLAKLASEGGELSLHCKGGSDSWLPTGSVKEVWSELERNPFPFEVTDDFEETILNAIEFYRDHSLLHGAVVVEMIAAASWTGRMSYYG